MSIQGAINKSVGIASALYTQTAGYKTKTEAKKEEAELAKLDALKAQAKETKNKHLEKRAEADIQRLARSSTNPNVASRYKYNPISSDKWIEAQERKRNRRNFMDYLRVMPTTIGRETGKTGDLPIEWQKAIAKQYDAKARQRIMNEADKEAGRGKYKR